MQTTNDSVFEKIFQISPQIRFVGIYKNNELKYSYREGTKPYIDENTTIKSLEQAVRRWKERKELLGSAMGNPMYSVTMYEQVKRITRELKDGSLVLLSTELEVNHEKILLELMDIKIN